MCHSLCANTQIKQVKYNGSMAAYVYLLNFIYLIKSTLMLSVSGHVALFTAPNVFTSHQLKHSHHQKRLRCYFWVIFQLGENDFSWSQSMSICLYLIIFFLPDHITWQYWSLLSDYQLCITFHDTNFGINWMFYVCIDKFYFISDTSTKWWPEWSRLGSN